MLIRRLKTLLSSKDGKVLFSNFSYLFLLQIAGYVFPLLTLPYLARVIGVDNFGRIAFASAIMVWIQTVADWGFNYTATRDVAKNRENKEKVSEIFSNVLWARCVLVLLSFMVLLILLCIVPQFRDNSEVILVTFLMIPGHVLFPDWFFQAVERMKYITILNILSKLFFTIAVFLFIKDEEDYILQPLFVSLGYVISGLIALYYILIKWRIKLVYSSVRNVLSAIKKSTDVFINNLMPNLYNSFTAVLLGLFGTPAQNGIYDAGKKFVSISANLLYVISRTTFPYLVRKFDKHYLYARISLILAFFASAILFIFAPLIIHIFFGKDFGESVVVLRITSVALFFIMMSSVYGTNFLIIRGFDKKLRNVTMIASIIGLIISFPLVYNFSFIGASLTYMISSMLLGSGSFLASRKVRNGL